MPEANTPVNLANRVGAAIEAEKAGDASGALATGRRLLDVADAAAVAAPIDGMAEALNRLGMLFVRHGQAAQALRAYRPALALVEGKLPADLDLLAQLHNNVGQALMLCGGQEEAALQHLEHAVALGQLGAVAELDRAVFEDNLGLLAARMGQTERAVALHQGALQTFERLRGPLHPDAATALANLGQACHDLGQRLYARACLLRALDVHLAAGQPGGSGALGAAVNLLKISLDKHDMPLAVELADVLLAMTKSQPTGAGHNAAEALLRAADAAFNAFELGLAERLCQAAQQQLAPTAGDDAEATLNARRLAAKIALEMGQLEQAERLQLALLERPAGDARSQAYDWIEYAKNVRNRDVRKEGTSVPLFEQAWHMMQALPDARPGDRAHALLNLGEVLFACGRFEEAEARYVEGLAALGAGTQPGRQGPYQEERALLNHARGLLAFRQSRHGDAATHLGRALQIWLRLRGAYHPFVATAASHLALVHWDRGDAAAAAKGLARCTRLRAPNLLRNLTVGDDNQRQRTASDAIADLYRALSLYFSTGAGATLATRLMLQHKGAAQVATARNQARLRERLDPESKAWLDQLMAVQSTITGLLAQEQLHGGRVDMNTLAPLQREAERLQRVLGHCGAQGHAGLVPLGLAAVRANLRGGAVLVDLLRWAQFRPQHQNPIGLRYAALVLRQRRAPQWIDLGDAVPIDNAVHAFRTAIVDAPLAPLLAAERELDTLLLRPLARALAGASRVIVAPDGELNLLPFATLLKARLPTDATVTQVAGAAELQPAADAVAAVTPPVALVDPDFDLGNTDGGVYEPLPASRQEGQLLQRLWPATRVLAGADATLERLQRVERPLLLHLATHGHFVTPAGDQPLITRTTLQSGKGVLLVQSAQRSARQSAMYQAGLALAGANRAPGVGVVSAAELAQLDLRGTVLVVLSACDTGAGRADPGAEFAGLRRAFALAGARSQLTSLWAADDEATGVLMGHFYSSLYAGLSRTQALRDAQQTVRARASWAHPFYWAGFVLWGEDGPLPSSLLMAPARMAT